MRRAEHADVDDRHEVPSVGGMSPSGQAVSVRVQLWVAVGWLIFGPLLTWRHELGLSAGYLIPLATAYVSLAVVRCLPDRPPGSYQRHMHGKVERAFRCGRRDRWRLLHQAYPGADGWSTDGKGGSRPIYPTHIRPDGWAPGRPVR